MASGLYAIHNTASGGFYLGSAVDLQRRKRQHFYDLRHGKHANQRLQRAWARYGEASLVWRVVAELDRADLLATEQRLLNRLRDLPTCYNASRVVTSGMGGRKHSPEAKRRMAAWTGKKHSPETRAKMAAAHEGRKWSQERRDKQAAEYRTKDWSEAVERRRATWEKMRQNGDPGYERIVAGRFQKGHAFVGLRDRRGSA